MLLTLRGLGLKFGSTVLLEDVALTVARGERIDVGQFRLVNLAAVREKAGDHWPSAKKKVFAAGTQFLAKRLSDDDAVIPCEEGFLVLFAEAPDDPATLVRIVSAVSVTACGATPSNSDSSRCRTSSLSPITPMTAMIASPAGKIASTLKNVSDAAASTP